MNAEEARTISSRGQKTEIEKLIAMACEKGRFDIELAPHIFEDNKDWLEANGYWSNGGGWSSSGGSFVIVTWMSPKPDNM